MLAKKHESMSRILSALGLDIDPALVRAVRFDFPADGPWTARVEADVTKGQAEAIGAIARDGVAVRIEVPGGSGA